MVEGIVAGDTPAFERWHGEGAVFAQTETSGMLGGMRGFRRTAKTFSDPHAAGAPVVTYTLYNDAAFQHIRRHNLHRRSALQGLSDAGERAVPAFPDEAVVLKTAWWPVASTGVTVMPVWDPELNPAQPRGNPYVSWRRVVGVGVTGTPSPARPMDFLGRAFREAREVPLKAFYSVRVDRAMATHLSQDPESRRSAAIALGRPLRAGDYLVLVGLNLMTHEQEDWVWAALWWHDEPNRGPFAAGRPPTLQGPWANYLMQAAFDEVAPLAEDGGPHIAFNPWLEARFPDGGQGGGTQSNCMACHRRAGAPAGAFLPVTRGGAEKDDNPATAKARLRTSFLWTLPLHAAP